MSTCPDVVLPLSALTEKDRRDLEFALDLGVEWLALSFVQRPEDLDEARELTRGRAGIMTKLEKPSAVEALDAIVDKSDAVMVARGDLGVELPAEKVPAIQRRIVRACRRAGKPVIVATQMLESMISSPVPTRAEASDVATAIYHGADAVMLSAESASGQVSARSRADDGTHHRGGGSRPLYRELLESPQTRAQATSADAICAAMDVIAGLLPVAAIVTYTTSGSTSLRAARERPRPPILSMTPEPRHRASSRTRVGGALGADARRFPRHGDGRARLSRAHATKVREAWRHHSDQRRHAVRHAGRDQPAAHRDSLRQSMARSRKSPDSRSSIRAATRRWPPKWCWPMERADSPPRLPAHRRARAKRWSSATATRSATSAKASRAPSATSTASLRQALVGRDADDQAAVDRRMIDLDGTPDQVATGCQRNPRRVDRRSEGRGAVSRCAAVPTHCAEHGLLVMPVPMMNIVNGGAHADNNVDMQEFMILPVGAPTLFRSASLGRRSVPHAQGRAEESRHCRRRSVTKVVSRPNLPSNEAALELIMQSIEKAGYRPGRDIWLGLDAASSEFHKDGHYELASEGKQLSSAEFVDYLAAWVDRYPILSIEDGMAEDDWDGWKLLTDRLGKRVQLVGDDLFVTNTAILEARHRQRCRELDPDQAEPDRHADRDAGGHRDGRCGRLHVGGLASLRRDRGHDDRRSRRLHGGDADQDRLVVPIRSRREVQPAAAHRARPADPQPSTPDAAHSAFRAVRPG